MKQCIRCRVIRDTTVCSKCVEEINAMDFDSARTERIIWGLMLLRTAGNVATSASHDELSAGTTDDSKLSEADHERLILGHEDGGLNWHYDERYGGYGFFT